MINSHKNDLTRPEILRNVKKHKIYEALIILKEKPSINRQNEDFLNVLKLYY